MSQFYDIDSTRWSHREYWWGTPSPAVVFTWILKWLRVRVPASSDDPNVESILPFMVESLPAEILGRFQPLLTELNALGFVDPVYHWIHDPGARTTIYWATLRHASEPHFARIHLRCWQRVTPPDRGLFPIFFTEFADGSFVITSAGKPDMAQPDPVQMRWRKGMPLSRLWSEHRDRAAAAGSTKIPRRVPTRDELIRAMERHHVLVRDFNLNRGVFRPRPAEAQAEAQSYSAAVQEAQEAGFEYPGALAELDRLQQQKPSWGNAIWLLVLSFVIFVALGAARWDSQFMLWLIPALLLHESGHWLAMRLFRYRNLRMFFIPLFGAAVTGQNYNVPGWKKALVSLAGPVPGIFLGATLGVVGLATGRPSLIDGGNIFLFLNAFNLLPILPLDGGHVLHTTLFCRHRWLDVAFRLIAIAGLVGLGLAGLSRILLYIAIPLGLGIPLALKLNRAVQAVRQASLPPPLPGEDRIPPATARALIVAVKQALPAGVGDKPLAQHALHVYESVNAHPPGAAATVGILAAHGGSFFFALVAFTVLTIGRHGKLSDFFQGAVRQARHKVECGEHRTWTGPGAGRGSPTPRSRNLIVATFANHKEAADQFDRLTGRLPDQAALTLFGRSLLLGLPSADDAGRETWFDEFQKVTKDPFVSLTNRPVGLRLSFVAPTEQVATNVERDLHAYFAATQERHLIAPWSPEARSPEFTQYQRRRRMWLHIVETMAGSYQDPRLQTNTLRFNAALKRGASGEMEKILKENEEFARDAAVRARASLRAEPRESLDPDLLDSYEGLSHLGYTNRAERAQLNRKIAERLGEIPFEGSRPSPEAASYGVVHGSVTAHGLLLRLPFASLNTPEIGAPALLDWLCAQGCRRIQYEFFSNASMSSGFREEE